MGEADKCPHAREPLSGTPTAQIGGREMIALCVPYTAPVFVWTHFKDMGDNKRPLSIAWETVAKFGWAKLGLRLQGAYPQGECSLPVSGG